MNEQETKKMEKICSLFNREDLKEDLRNLKDIDSFGTMKELRELESILAANERIKYLTSGLLDGNTWLIVCTQKRLLFIDKGMMYGIKQKSIPLEKISSISHTKGLIFSKIMIQEGTNNFTIDNLFKETIDYMVNAIENQIELLKNDSKTNNIKNSPSSLDELKKLKELLDVNAITIDEYEVLKEKIIKNY